MFWLGPDSSVSVLPSHCEREARAPRKPAQCRAQAWEKEWAPLTPRGSSRGILGGLSSPPPTPGTQGCRGMAAGSSWCRLRAASDSGHLIEGSFMCQTHRRHLQNNPMGQELFSRPVHRGQRAESTHERHAGRHGFKPTLRLQTPCVQTYMTVV